MYMQLEPGPSASMMMCTLIHMQPPQGLYWGQGNSGYLISGENNDYSSVPRVSWWLNYHTLWIFVLIFEISLLFNFCGWQPLPYNIMFVWTMNNFCGSDCKQRKITIIFSQSTVLAAVCVSAWVCHCVLWWRYVLTSVHSIGENSIAAEGAVSIAEALTKTPNLQQFKLGYVITYMHPYVAATLDQADYSYLSRPWDNWLIILLS